METKNFREKLILTADDFGKSPEANANILTLAQAGKLDRISVLINKPLSPQEIDALLQTGVKIDIHLSLPTGIRVNKLSYGESALKRSVLFILKYLSGQISTARMEKEWHQQIEKFKLIFGKNPDGINSHQHIHFFSPYFKIVLHLAQEYSINYVRLGNDRLLKGSTNVYRILSLFQKTNKRHLGALKINSSDHLVSLDWIPNFDQFLDNLPSGTTEIICHPERRHEHELLEKYF